MAATKSVIAALTASAALVAAWARRRRAGATRLANCRSRWRRRRRRRRRLVEAIAAAKSAFVLGRGSTFAVAAEAALKLKETCALHAEAFSAAEVMHGPAEIVKPGFLVLAFPPQRRGRRGLCRRAGAVRGARRAGDRGGGGGEDSDDRLGAAGPGHPLLAPIAMIHRFYALSEAAARALGRDPDRPSHLGKVTETR